MLALLKRLRNWLIYGLAATVILLAVMVGLFRLFLPRLTEYQEDIKGWATAALGVDVDFSGMDARWRLSGPELNFYEAELTLPGESEALIEASEVIVGVGLLRLLVDRTLVVDRVVVSETELEFSRDADGVLRVQGLLPDEITALVPASGEAGDVVVEGRNIALSYLREGEPPFAVELTELEATRRDDTLALEASVDVDDGFSSRLTLSADRIGDPESSDSVWQLYADGRALSLERWAALIPQGIAPVVSGYGDLDVWIEVDETGFSKATANVALQDFGVAGATRSDTIDIDGRFEFAQTEQGKLFAADNASIVSATGRWPDSSVSIELGTDAEGALDDLRVTASYLSFGDAGYFSPWLPGAIAEYLERYQPTGEVRDLRLGLSSLTSESPSFEVVAEADRIGVAAVDAYPGIRELSGTLRADNDGGRIELASIGAKVSLPNYLPEDVILDDASGTIIWRRSGEQLTVLSDRLVLRGADFESRSSIQVTVPAAGETPIVDLDSRWGISDVASAKRLLPEPVMHPKLYRWFETALVSGRMENGRTRLTGRLDQFPFDDGDGVFEVNAVLEDALLDYASGWPTTAISSMEVSLVGLGLSTARNVATTLGNRTENARVEIADLRKPVLMIEAFASGTLESIRQFGLNSPIGGVFGGRLENVQVAGDATFTLDLTYPINDRQNYEFETLIRPAGGSLALDGFPAPVTDLHGSVTVSRRAISSDSLFGTFLDQHVDIELSSAGPEQPNYSVILEADGLATTAGLIDGLRAPLGGVIDGSAMYHATVHFPRPGSEVPAPVRLLIESDLAGFGIDLPAPLAKPAAGETDLSLAIEFPAAGQIAASGTLADSLRWSSQFFQDESGWDFDRGVLALGGSYPGVADSRGLHVEGHAEDLRFSEWLSLADRSGGAGRGILERIRSIDLAINHLRLFGQHLEDHRVRLDRSGAEWYVTSSGELVQGTATIPYDFNGGRPIVLDMQRMFLPGDDTADASDDSTVATLDPRTLPPISISAGEFAIGDRHVGSLTAEFRKTVAGLVAESVRTEDDSFTIEGSASWVFNPEREESFESVITASLVSSNVKPTLARLGYGPFVDSERMVLDAEVSWPGGPRADFLDHIDGTVSVALSGGQLEEVEPGAGRVFGLMSVVELPRRLSLDFRDVFDKGFGFDEISGDFRLDDGDAFTCDLSLKGPAADIGIVGRVGLRDGVYSQTAVVSANVGNTLPVVGAVVAGPQVAAALLIFSQIFKKPLQEMGQVYYSIDGDLESPKVDGANAERFAETSREAACLPAQE